jgi:hypothetical protein
LLGGSLFGHRRLVPVISLVIALALAGGSDVHVLISVAEIQKLLANAGRKLSLIRLRLRC